MTDERTALGQQAPQPSPSAPGGGPARSAGHRRDIDGLRAVAVGLVVAYHAGVPLVTGGYVGVDVFFVISGFLITGLLIAEVERTGRISISSFYARRARRLLPASALVLLVTMVVAHLVMSPFAAEATDRDAIAAALYVANWVFAAQSSDYFAAQVDASPLLHYWSLGVEEQFYVVWPLLILGTLALGRTLHRRGRAVAGVRSRVGLGLAIVGLGSLLMSATLTASQPGWSYYGLHTRAWELALGAGLALVAPHLPRLGRGVAVAAGWSGLLLIVWSAVTFDERTPFPGTAALIPVLGAALVLAAGSRGTRAGAPRLLSARPAVHVGLISYSWYLWHWPALVFARYLTAGPAVDGLTPEPPAWVVALAVLVSYLLARATTRFVESPVRTSTRLGRDIRRSLALGAVLTAVPVVVALLPLPGPVVDRVPVQTVSSGDQLASGVVCEEGAADPCAEAKQLLANLPDVAPAVAPAVAADDYVKGGDECQAGYGGGPPPESCVYGDPKGSRTVVLVGDSKARQWLPAIDAAGRERGWRVHVWTRTACPFADVVVYNAPGDERYTACETWRAAVVGRIRNVVDAEGVDLLVVGRSVAYARLVAEGQGLTSQDQVSRAWDKAVTSTLTDVGGVGQVLLLGDLSFAPADPVECLSAHLSESSQCGFLATVRQSELTLVAGESQVVLDGVEVAAAPTALLPCPQDVCAALTPEGTMTYRDPGHITASYSRGLGKRFGDLLAAWLKG